MNNTLENLPPLKDVLQKHDLFAKKSLGQHFLLDLNLTDKIARLAAPHEMVIEVGPGPGGLTRSLLMAGAERVIAIEKDERFLPALQDIVSVADARLHIINEDALRTDPANLSDIRPLRICANLPYNVGTKLLINWLTAAPPFWDRLVLMLQKEVAERVVATPGNKAYGRLAVLAGSIAHGHISFDIPASAFTPPPKVDSAVIVLDILPENKRFGDLKLLGQITAGAFGQRRKMLRKSLKPLAKTHSIDLNDWLTKANIDPTARPETIDIAGFHRLAQSLTSFNQPLDKRA
ncbi:MAG: 16S rRNA (adenine(1518)-N(6)/adenine(1519)-N(6))-dimethyltransferase RsmA [Robiginitomaculum sp.]|nr:16S rRNA (adenine(1518)-N(6)/adenine(1519)-N(6))-dimethyltransferase RsmA [Robiginitomaculum sp.]